VLDEPSVGCIIVVEDDVDLRETLRRALSREGYQVTGVGSAEEALSLVRKRPFDLAIVDLVLPDMGGMRLLEELRDLGLMPPTVVMTAYGGRVNYHRALELGVSEFLVKPVKLVEVYRAVRTVLARS
jgi:DNA-binding response OmpR family regulator